ncbi:hypothetical protein DITRI_Ditri10aG0162200 [Diplodiscus trichospermus]
MANSEEKPIFMHKMDPPSKHQDFKGEDVDDYEDEVWDKGCDWFRLFCLKRRRNNIDETDTLLHQSGEHRETWWKSKVKKLKEFSEKLAGPKWKNFIRKMSGYCNKRKTQKNRFQYDAYSYALNFDDGADKEGDDLLQGFSSRFAAPPFADERQRAGSGL